MKKDNKIALIVWIIIIVVVILSIAAYNRSTLFCKYVTKYKTESRIETYTSSVKGCDEIADCYCLHKGWLGMGACDSCECRRRVSDNIPYEEKVCPWD